MRIVAAPVAQVMPVADMGLTSGTDVDFGAMLADAGAETSGEGDVAVVGDDVVAVDPAVVPVAVPVLAVPVIPVMQILPPPTGGRVDGLVLPASVRDGGALPKVSVPIAVSEFEAVVSSRSPSPQPSPRGGEGAFVVPVADVAPAGAMMRDVSALLAAQPAPVAIVPPVAPAIVQAVAPPPVGVAEAAIREQVAALVAGDDDPEIDVGGDPIAVAAMPATPALQGAAPASALPVLSADGALGLHVAAAQAGQELDGITRDIAATNGSGDAPMRFRLDPAALGPVMVEVARGLDGLAVRIEARDGGVRDLIADQQPRLVTDARAAGVQIATVQVEARREDVATSSSSYQQAGGQPSQSSSGQSGQRPAPPVPAATWTRATPRTADTATGPRAASELYA